MKHVLICLLFSTLLILTATAVYADCYQDGRWYRTGARVGDFVCRPDGSWEYRP